MKMGGEIIWFPSVEDKNNVLKHDRGGTGSNCSLYGTFACN